MHPIFSHYLSSQLMQDGISFLLHRLACGPIRGIFGLARVKEVPTLDETRVRQIKTWERSKAIATTRASGA